MDPSGVAKLHTHGNFEHPRVTTGHNRSVTFDTIVATSREKNGITCSLRYSLNNEEDVPELMSGAYDFEAKVRSSVQSFSLAFSFIQLSHRLSPFSPAHTFPARCVKTQNFI